MAIDEMRDVLEATGYLVNGQPAHGVHVGEDAHRRCRARDFRPDGMWSGESSLTVYFKSEPEAPPDDQVAEWRREIWNQGFAPLLWVVSPEQIDLYNGFGQPQETGDAAEHRLQTFQRIEEELERLDAFAGRLAMETGTFWQEPNARNVNRESSVDRRLLSDLAKLERNLVEAGMSRSDAQGLIGRTIFTQYLIDRQIITTRNLADLYGYNTLADILQDRHATERLFDWLRETFNGDMFPSEKSPIPSDGHLRRVSDFLSATDPDSRQGSLFPYQFDVIPVELISSIYEQFARGEDPTSDFGHGRDVFYTPLPLVSLVLDEVTEGLTGRETLLDLTCGSGVFLVEALRRLVRIRSGGAEPTRRLIRSTLHKQIYGVDISEAAVRVAAFSLYLAALELDPKPKPPHALKFKPLIGETLIVGDAHDEALLTKRGSRKQFDVIVGNPPWSYKGREATAARRYESREGADAPRGEGIRFVRRAIDFASDNTRFGLVLSATQFFSRSGTGADAVRQLVDTLSPVTLVNLSNQSDWLFSNAKMPAVVLFAKHRSATRDIITTVQVPWSPSGNHSHTFEIAPSDISTLSLGEWQRKPELLKAAFFGCRRDLALLDWLTSSQDTLENRLGQLGLRLCTGLKFGDRSRDAKFLYGMPFLGKRDLRPFLLPSELPSFREPKAEGPRSFAIYRAPLLLLKEFLSVETGRLTVAVTEQDTVFTDAYYGIAFPAKHRKLAYLLATILSSSFASWFFLMTASTFGVLMRSIRRADAIQIPVPDLETIAFSEAGQRLLRLSQDMHRTPLQDNHWQTLDEAVFDLYGMNETERIVVRDGMFRASWQWSRGRTESVEAADPKTHILEYARTFLTALEVWFTARKHRHMRAEVFDLPKHAPLRVVRFILEDRYAQSEPELLAPGETLREILNRIGRRLDVSLPASLSGRRELRAHGSREVIIIKPSARRHWLGVSALEDADAVILESFSGTLHETAT